jgi:hypothetical protein
MSPVFLDVSRSPNGGRARLQRTLGSSSCPKASRLGYGDGGAVKGFLENNRLNFGVPTAATFPKNGHEVLRYNCIGRVVVSQTGSLVRQLIYHERRNKRTRFLLL